MGLDQVPIAQIAQGSCLPRLLASLAKMYHSLGYLLIGVNFTLRKKSKVPRDSRQMAPLETVQLVRVVNELADYHLDQDLIPFTSDLQSVPFPHLFILGRLRSVMIL